MGFNWAGATAGLLGEVGAQANTYVARQEELERRKLEQAIADRKEQAALAREAAMMEYNYYREDAKDARDEKRLEAMADRDDKRYAAQEALLDKRMSAQEAAAERRHRESIGGGGGQKEYEDDRKLKRIDDALANGEITPEKARELKLYVLGDKPVETEKKGGLSEYQQMQAEEKLAEIEVTDDVTMKQANAIRKRLGMPLLKKTETDPGRKGILGVGSKDPVYEYVEDYEGMDGGKESASKAPGEQSKEAEKGKTGKSLLDQVDKILPPAGAKAEAKPEEEQARDLNKPPTKAANTDLGSVLGLIVNGGVGAVKQLADNGQDLLELDRQLTAEVQSAHGESKSAILKALAAVRQVMNTKETVNYQENASKWRSR